LCNRRAETVIILRIPGKESFEVLGGRGSGQLGEQMREIRVRLDAAGLGGLDERIQARAGYGAGDRLTEKPVPASITKGADRVLHPVGVGTPEMSPAILRMRDERA
jgi:hypothetical protein